MAQAQFWLTEGTVVGGRYRLESVLGVGGYGITYKGMDLRLERNVAVKEFYPSFWVSRFSEMSPEVRIMQGMEENFEKGMSRFVDEAKTLAHLSDIPAVVRVSDVFPENNTTYLVMDFLDGKNLKQMAEGFGGRIPPDVLLPVISPVIAALRQVHEKGLIHRDISPDNIMMLSDGSVRLIDFGNARDTTDNKSMTLAMKEGFAAPEQYRSKGQGSWTDVYGLCASVYYCLTGKLPPQAMERLMGAPFPTPSEMGIPMNPVQEKAIMDGMDLYVKQRIQNMEDLWNRLYVDSVAQPEPEPQPVADSYPMTQPVNYDAYRNFDWQAQQTPVQGNQNQVSYVPVDNYSYYQPQDSVHTSGLAHFRSICAQIFQKIKEF